jgi:hypothetical protein
VVSVSRGLDDVYRDLIRSVDSAIRDLLVSESDPLALACYLWTLRRHDVRLVNSDQLASWGARWSSQVLIDGVVSRRKDEEVTAAALAAASLVGTTALQPVVEGVQQSLSQLLGTIIDRQGVPFGRASYGAIVLYGAQAVGVQDRILEASTAAVAAAFQRSLAGGRTFGIGFLAELLSGSDRNSQLEELRAAIESAFNNPSSGYEDQAYLLQAMWSLDAAAIAESELVARTEEVLANSPVWPYLMAGVGDVEPAGDRQTSVTVSHVYRASLLDLVIRSRVRRTNLSQAQFDARYRGSRVIGAAAFGFGCVVLASLWAVLLALMVPVRDAAWQYWVVHDYSKMPSDAALLFLGGMALLLLLLIDSPIAVWTLWQLLVRRAILSDQHMIELLVSRLRWGLVGWFAFLVVAGSVNLATGVLGPGLQHALTGQ